MSPFRCPRDRQDCRKHCNRAASPIDAEPGHLKNPEPADFLHLLNQPAPRLQLLLVEMSSEFSSVFSVSFHYIGRDYGVLVARKFPTEKWCFSASLQSQSVKLVNYFSWNIHSRARV